MTKKVKNFLAGQYSAANKRFFRAGLIVVGVLALALVNYVSAINTQSEGYKSLPNSTMTVSSPRGSKTVQNNSGNTYFIPTKTAAEWDTFTSSYSAINVNVNVCELASQSFNYGAAVTSYSKNSVGCAESCSSFSKAHTCQIDGTWSNAPAYSYASCSVTSCGSNVCCNNACCASGQNCYNNACCTSSWGNWSSCSGCTPNCDQSCTATNGQSRTDGCGNTQYQNCTIAATGCSFPAICYNHSCCIPQTCASLGKSCGSWPNGCGGSTPSCGSCSGCYATCSNGTCAWSCAGGQVCYNNTCCTPSCPACRISNVPDGCGGTCFKNANCCRDQDCSFPKRCVSGNCI